MSGPDFTYEQALIAKGIVTIAGTDEVGRGPLAGPVVAAAVVLDPLNIPEGLNDSKKISAKKRTHARGHGSAEVFGDLHSAIVGSVNPRISSDDFRPSIVRNEINFGGLKGAGSCCANQHKSQSVSRQRVHASFYFSTSRRVSFSYNLQDRSKIRMSTPLAFLTSATCSAPPSHRALSMKGLV